MAAAISDDLGRAHGTVPDAQIVNGSGSGQNMRGLLNVAGILTVTGTVATGATFLESVWKAYSALAGGSGYGSANIDQYVAVRPPPPSRLGAREHDRDSGAGALSWDSGRLRGCSHQPGRWHERRRRARRRRSAVILVGGSPTFRAFEDVGSGTLTARISGWNQAALVVKHPAAVARVAGLTAATGF